MILQILALFFTAYADIQPGSNESLVVGNITGGRATGFDGKLRSPISSNIVLADKALLDENLKILKAAFAPHLQNANITPERKNALKEVMKKAMHGDSPTLEKLVKKGILKPEDAQRITDMTFRHTDAAPTPNSQKVIVNPPAANHNLSALPIVAPSGSSPGLTGPGSFSQEHLDGDQNNISSYSNTSGYNNEVNSPSSYASGSQDQQSNNFANQNGLPPGIEQLRTAANYFINEIYPNQTALLDAARRGDPVAQEQLRRIDTFYPLAKDVANGIQGPGMQEFAEKLENGYISSLSNHFVTSNDINSINRPDPTTQGKIDMGRTEEQRSIKPPIGSEFKRGEVYPEGLDESNLKNDLHMSPEELANLELTNLVKGAYDEARDSGLDHQSALLNSQAALNYAQSYHRGIRNGLPPAQADIQAMQVFQNLKHILPNDQDLIEEKNHIVSEEKGIKKALHPHDLYKGYNSKDLEKAVADRKALEERLNKINQELARKIQQSMYENNLKHKLAEEHEKAAKVEAMKAQALRNSTLEAKFENLKNGGDPILKTPKMQKQILKKRSQYEQMIGEGVGKTVKKQSAEQLMKANRVDKGIQQKNAKIAKRYKEIAEEKKAKQMKAEEMRREALAQKEKEEQEKNHKKKQNAAKFDSALYNSVMQEQQEAKHLEESKAQQAMALQIGEAKNMAYNNVKNLGGSEQTAQQAAAKAGAIKAGELKQELNKITQEHAGALGAQMDQSSAQQIAEHIALAHSGLTVTGNSIAEIGQKEANAAEQQEMTDESLGVIRVLPDDVEEVELANVQVKLPLKIVPNIKASTAEEQEVKTKQAKLRELLRNKISKEEFNSGLKTFKAEDGVFNVTESATGIHIDNGRVKVTPEGFEKMKAENMDTSPFHSQIDSNETYYAADVHDMDMKTPTDFAPNVPKTLSNANESIDLTHADSIEITSGSLKMIPWSKFKDSMRPEVHQAVATDTEIVSEEARERFEAMERQQKMLQGTQVKTFTNPEGTAYADVTPAYGLTQRMGIHEAIETLENEEKKAGMPQDAGAVNHLDMEENAVDSNSLNQFMESVKMTHLHNSDLTQNLGTKNPLTKQENTEISQAMNHRAEMNQLMNSTMRTGNSEDVTIFNNMVQNSSNLAKSLGMSQGKFLQQLSTLSSSTINQMIQFIRNMSSSSNPNLVLETLAQQPFYSSLKSAFPGINPSKVFNSSSTAIHNVINIVNPATANIVEKTRLPPGTTGLIGTDANGNQAGFIPAINGSQVISSVQTTGPNPQLRPNYNPGTLPLFNGPNRITTPPISNNLTASGNTIQRNNNSTASGNNNNSTASGNNNSTASGNNDYSTASGNNNGMPVSGAPGSNPSGTPLPPGTRLPGANGSMVPPTTPPTNLNPGNGSAKLPPPSGAGKLLNHQVPKIN